MAQGNLNTLSDFAVHKFPSLSFRSIHPLLSSLSLSSSLKLNDENLFHSDESMCHARAAATLHTADAVVKNDISKNVIQKPSFTHSITIKPQFNYHHISLASTLLFASARQHLGIYRYLPLCSAWVWPGPDARCCSCCCCCCSDVHYSAASTAIKDR